MRRGAGFLQPRGEVQLQEEKIMTSPIAGVWELVSGDEVGLFVVTETHFSDVTMKKDRKP